MMKSKVMNLKKRKIADNEICIFQTESSEIKNHFG